MIPYGKQSIDASDIEAVTRALQSDYLTTGPEVEAFEQEFAERVGAKYAVAVCNATAALHLAMLVANIGKGDRVVTSPNTFLSSANCAAFVGAVPDFVDIEPKSQNMDPEALRAFWKPDVKAVVVVDYAGRPANTPAIAEIAHGHGAIVIEDACHALGSRFQANGTTYSVGGHSWADITTYSFHPVKTITSGEGGMLVTNNKAYADRARRLRSHGMVRDPEEMIGFGRVGAPTSGPWVYEMQELGFNYRITELQCALGRSQLRKLEPFILRRREIVSHYNAAFSGYENFITPEIGAEIFPATFKLKQESISWHLYTLQIDFAAMKKTRGEVMQALRDQGIGTQVLYTPVYWQPWYAKTYGYRVGKCPQAEACYEQSLSLPLHCGLSDADIGKVVAAVSGLCQPVAGK
jgi:perosamine synthetase